MVTHRGPINPFAAARDELSGKFLVWEPLRRGTYSAVFAAHDVRSGERVTLHVVLRSALARAMVSDQFRQALAEADSLEHPGIVRMLSRGNTTSFEWYSTQLVDLDTQLSSQLRSGVPFEIDALVPAIRHVGEALNAAQKAGVVHGHVSPATVFVGHDGVVRVSEFATRRIMNMLARSPAQSDARPALTGSAESFDALQRRDRYSLALLFYECFAGHALDTTGATADAFRALHERVEARGPISQAAKDELVRALGNAAGQPASLPTVMELADVLGQSARTEHDEELPAVVPVEGDERGMVVFLDEPSLIFAAEPPPPKRRWPMLASVAMVTCVTWLALEQFPVGPRESAADTVIITRSSATLNEEALSQPQDTLQNAVLARGAEPLLPANLSTAAVSAPTESAASAGARAVARSAAPEPPIVVATNARKPAATTSQPRPRDTKAQNVPARKEGAPIDGTLSTPVVIAQAKLSISTRPWGYLYLNGTLVGNTPASNIVIPPGTHSLRVVREGFQAHEREISVAPGAQIRLIDVVLTRIVP